MDQLSSSTSRRLGQQRPNKPSQTLGKLMFMDPHSVSEASPVDLPETRVVMVVYLIGQ